MIAVGISAETGFLIATDFFAGFNLAFFFRMVEVAFFLGTDFLTVFRAPAFRVFFRNPLGRSPVQRPSGVAWRESRAHFPLISDRPFHPC
jgi:hypothetical protein